MGKKIFVNATSCTSGGALSILHQFIKSIDKYDKVNFYYIFSTVDLNIDNKNIKNIKNISNIKGKKYKDRLYWDICGIQKWSKKNKIDPDVIISLQNTAVRFNGKKQIVYIHQSLPYSKESRWNFLRKEERKYWFYKNIFKIWMHKSISKDMYIVVQNNWMKQAVLKYGYLDKNIRVCNPDVGIIEIDKVQEISFNNKINFFYPAADYIYKNHKILINSLEYLKNICSIEYENINMIFTLSKHSYIYELAKKKGVDEKITFIGELQYSEVLEYYKLSHVIVFPSYIETVGLPLIEACAFGKRILVSDCEYSKETLKGYELAKYLEHNDYKLWALEITKACGKYNCSPTTIERDTSWQDIFKLL